MAYSIQDISEYLGPYATYGGWGGPSIADQYRNASRQQGALRDLYDTVADDGLTKDQFNYFNSGLKAQKGQAIANGAIAGLTGLTTLAGNAMSAAQIRDTSVQEGQIDDLSRAGNYNYNNFEQLSNDYAQTNFNPSFGYDEIRGMSTGQQIGSVATSALSGAATGMQVAGPWGALAGGVVGLGTGLAGVMTGNEKARLKQSYLNSSADIASDVSQMNFQAAHERIRNNNNRNAAINMVAEGGQIRHQQSMMEFADRILKKPTQSESKPVSRVIRTKGEGGTTIRIRIK